MSALDIALVIAGLGQWLGVFYWDARAKRMSNALFWARLISPLLMIVLLSIVILRSLR